MQKLYSNSSEQTIEIAKEFAKTLKCGDIILLEGDLGAGKTIFTKGIVSALSNGKEIAISPTFVILNIYNTIPEVYHFDLYRIGDISELDAIGFEEYLFGDGISIIEWPSRAEKIFPNSAIKITIKKINDTKREICIER